MAKKQEKIETPIKISDEEKAIIARKKRIAYSGLTSEKVEDINAREAFRIYFIQLKKKVNLSSDLENIIWLHLKAMKFDKPELFAQGVKHFGYTI